MSVSIGSVTLDDAWIVNKYGGEYSTSGAGGGGLKQWIDEHGQEAFALPVPPCQKIIEEIKAKSEKGKRVIVALDGTEYIVECGSLSDINNPTPPSASVSASTGNAKVGDIIFILVNLQGNVVWQGVDNYGQTHTLSRSGIVTVRITDEWDKYVLRWNACSATDSIGSGTVTIVVSPNPRYSTSRTTGARKQIRINTCTSTQARALGALLGSAVNVSDGEVSFSGTVVRVELTYVADDMPDIAVKSRQGVDIYTGIVEVETT